jgi:hypothetical protein
VYDKALSAGVLEFVLKALMTGVKEFWMRMPPPTQATESPESSGMGKMPPPGSPEPGAKPEGAKATSEEVGAVLSDKHCVDCANWNPDSGECSKVEGVWDPESGCAKFFEPEHDESAETPVDEAAEQGPGRPEGM